MKIEGIAYVPHSNSVTKVPTEQTARNQDKDFSEYIKVKQNSQQGVSIPRNVTREMVQDFAEWYFKQGHLYESAKSYKMAIAAYEKSNSVEPDISKVSSIDSARQKAYPVNEKHS